MASLFGSVLYLPTLILPAAEKTALAKGTLSVASLNHIIMALSLLAFLVFWVSHLLIVLRLIFRRLAEHRNRVRNMVSNTKGVDLRWIEGFGLFIGASVLIVVADNALSLTVDQPLLDNASGALLETLIISGLALFGLLQTSAIPQVASELRKAAGVPPTLQGHTARYTKSPLALTDCEAIVTRLDAAMTKYELWRDPFLDLKTLSERIATRPYYVTQALNTVQGRNFYDYVNGWRIRAAALALTESDDSVLSISEAVGFNAKSTFNSAFRKEMSVTPTLYRQTNRKRLDI